MPSNKNNQRDPRLSGYQLLLQEMNNTAVENETDAGGYRWS
jgi:hypothetical protein